MHPPGTYRLEAGLFDCESKTQMRSAPVEITVTAPRGNDSAAWTEFASDPDLAYLVQTGGPRGQLIGSTGVEQAAMLQTIVDRYPTSVYASQIRASLTRRSTFPARPNRTSEERAVATGAHAPSLRRLLRALTTRFLRSSWQRLL